MTRADRLARKAKAERDRRTADPQRALEARRRYLATRRDKDRELDRLRYQRDPSKKLAAVRRFRERHPHKIIGYRLHKYGLTLESIEVMRTAQRNTCAICRRAFDATHRLSRMCVDHDHATGKTRALLCGGCNSALGYARESSDTLLSAATYLERFRP